MSRAPERGFALIIPADLRKRLRFHFMRREPSLCRLQRIVGGYIERVPEWDSHTGIPCSVYCNEEGKLHGLPMNPRATGFWWAHMGQRVDDVLVGNVVMCAGFREDADDDC